MLNTAVWTPNTVVREALHMSDQVEDFDEIDSLPSALAVGVTRPTPPQKPYVYGQHASKAELMRELWNLTHPHDPMP